MKLDDWLKAENKTSAEFARLSGIGDRQAVHKYRHGHRFPTPENLQRIRKATGGAVTPNDFADQHAPATSTTPKPTTKRSANKSAAKPVDKPKAARSGLAPAAQATLAPVPQDEAA